MIVYNYTPLDHYYGMYQFSPPGVLITTQWQGICMLAYPEAALDLIFHNETFKDIK